VYFAFLGSVFGFLGVAAGAFGAHVLRQRLGPDMFEIFEVAVRYQLYHALALLFTAWLCERTDTTLAHWAGWFFVGGIVIFSGSLYLLVLMGQRWLGVITPIGGGAFLLAWTLLGWVALRQWLT